MSSHYRKQPHRGPSRLDRPPLIIRQDGTTFRGPSLGERVNQLYDATRFEAVGAVAGVVAMKGYYELSELCRQTDALATTTTVPDSVNLQLADLFQPHPPYEPFGWLLAGAVIGSAIGNAVKGQDTIISKAMARLRDVAIGIGDATREIAYTLAPDYFAKR
jgi:hypothetical protein